MHGFNPASIAVSYGHLPALLALSTEPLVRLRFLDIAIIAIYFAMVIWIGF